MDKNEFTVLNKSHSIESILNSKLNQKPKKMGIKVQDMSSANDIITLKSNYDLITTNKINNINNELSPNLTNSFTLPQRSKLKPQSFESSLILMHKFFKEQKIYTDPNDNFKRRTVVLVRSPSSKQNITNLKSKHNLSDSSLFKFNTTSNTNSTNHINHNTSGEFGFNLQTYGLLNSYTKETEYICFVNNVQPKSPAKRAGLNNGDVLLAIDGIQIDQFKSFIDISKHVKGKNELRLVIMAENVCKKIQYQQRIEQIKKILAEKKLDLEKICQQEEDLMKKYGITKLNIPSPVLNKHTGFSTPSTNNNNTMSLSTASSISITSSGNNRTNSDFITSPNSTFLSPNMSSSGIVSESTNTSVSVSNSSSFSSSVTNSSLTNSKNMIIIKNSTPIENYNTNTNNSKQKNSFITSPTSSNINTQEDFSNKTSSGFIKLIKSNETSSATLNKSKSLAKKYLEQTSRLVRSASSSSLNLLSNFKINSSSSNITASTATTIKANSNQKNKENENLNFETLFNSIKNKPVLRTKDRLNSNRQRSYTTSQFDSESKLTLKDATTSATSTDESYSVLISSNSPSQIKSGSDTLNRVVRLNNHYDTGNFSKKKSLFNRLNNSAHSFDTSFSNSYNSYSFNNSSINNSTNKSYLKEDDLLNKSRSNSVKKEKNFLFNILTNKPKLSKNTTSDQLDKSFVRKSDSNNFKGEYASIRSNFVDYANLKAKQDENRKSEFMNQDNVARIKSNGGTSSNDINNKLNQTVSILNNSVSFLSHDEDVEHEWKNNEQIFNRPIPVIDHSNDDYVVTRL